MNHPEKILRTLDRHLTHPTKLILYGRAALALGFPDSSPEFHATMDVDAILPQAEMSAIEEDDSFWDAISKTNQELESTGLYLTHLFADDQVILSPDWLDHLSSIYLQDSHLLRLFRPAAEDLILTKMMRVDPQDRSDIKFLLARTPNHISTLPAYLERAIVPEIPEIQEAFEINLLWLRDLIANK